VPNFIAAAYLITYHAEHNIVPMEAKVHNAQLDTMCMKNGVHMNTISQIASWDLEEIKALNPVYKTAFIPKMTPARCLTGPMEKINLLVSFEDSLYSLEKFIYAPRPPVPKPVLVVPQDSTQNMDSSSMSTAVVDSLKPTNENLQYHKVKSGENLKNIALKYNVTIEQIMEWNGLQTTNIYVGQKLKLFSSQSVTPTPAPAPRPVQPTKKYYNVKPGDTFGKIAQRNNLSQGQLQRLNPGVNINNISVGQRIRIK
jgi:membrane-bound lytic murein transglycosylase D